jgi:hypothetical protein
MVGSVATSGCSIAVDAPFSTETEFSAFVFSLISLTEVAAAG